VLILRYAPTERSAYAARAEYYSDQDQVIIATGTTNGFQALGYSLNMDVRINKIALWRIECRSFNNPKDRIFTDSDQAASHFNYFVGTSLSLAF
jgi:hypothetical protein